MKTVSQNASELKQLFTSETLYTQKGVEHLHARFSKALSAQNTETYLQKAPVFDQFISDLFGIDSHLTALKKRYGDLHSLPKFRRDFIQRYVLRLPNPSPQEPYETVQAHFIALLGEGFDQDILTFAQHVIGKLNTYGLKPEAFYWETAYCLHKLPTKEWNFLNKEKHFPFSPTNGTWHCPLEEQTHRQGFALTDPGASDAYLMEESGYCLKCHKRQKDSCRTGLESPSEGPALHGCPLDQKISEMIELIEAGHLLSALATVMVDNPLLAATGHRICNDCQKACLFQTQKPVDVPQIETRLLKDILELPHGFEIYSLLTRWNPFHETQPLPNPNTQKAIFIAGAGPAGFTLAHHLMRLGHSVFVAEGLQIDPLPPHLTPKEPAQIPLIQNISNLFSPLEERPHRGFGGVMDYGITARWDKNFLTLIRLILERSPRYFHQDGIRLGRTTPITQVIKEGFQHISLCTGAGKPNMLPLKELPKGVRLGVDYLMGLHLTHKSLDLKKPLKLPAYVYGAGLTAIDTATEVLAGYVEQLHLIHRLTQEKDPRLNLLSPEELALFRAHHEALIKAPSPLERKKLLQSWGGVTVVYRKPLTQAPSYRLSAHEVENALYEGIQIQENTEILSWETVNGHLSHLRFRNTQTTESCTQPARTLFLALGTQPNTTVLEEDPSLQHLSRPLTFLNKGGQPHATTPNPKEPQPLFIHVTPEGPSITALGDLHPTFEGSVVKAMASAKQAAMQIDEQLKALPPTNLNLSAYAQRFDSHVLSITPLSPTLLELHLSAPAHVKNHQLGHFYKINAYEGSPLSFLEGRAITPVSIDKKAGTFKVLFALKSPLPDVTLLGKEPVYLLGPLGTPLQVAPSTSSVHVHTHPLNVYLLSIAHALSETHQLQALTFTPTPTETEQTLHQTYFPITENKSQAPSLLITDAQADLPALKNTKVLHLNAKPLQCMMGGICAHCIKPDPQTPGKWVFSCQTQWT